VVSIDRRRFIQVTGGAAAATLLNESIATGGLYDVRVAVDGSSYARELAGHVGGDQPSISDPALGR
jgi:hypothetical protein